MSIEISSTNIQVLTKFLACQIGLFPASRITKNATRFLVELNIPISQIPELIQIIESVIARATSLSSLQDLEDADLETTLLELLASELGRPTTYLEILASELNRLTQSTTKADPLPPTEDPAKRMLAFLDNPTELSLTDLSPGNSAFEIRRLDGRFRIYLNKEGKLEYIPPDDETDLSDDETDLSSLL
jgi:hypothetical protein